MYESFPTVDIVPRYLNVFFLLLQKALESIASSSDSQECNNFQATVMKQPAFYPHPCCVFSSGLTSLMQILIGCPG